MQAKPKLTSSGQIEVDGALYRIAEPEGEQRYSVVRESDGLVIGSFRLGELGKVPHEDAVDEDALEPEVVLAIARLMAAPRGILPIQ